MADENTDTPSNGIVPELSSEAADTGTPVTPADTGTPVTPADTGTPVTPADTGTPVTPADTGTQITPTDSSPSLTPVEHSVPVSKATQSAPTGTGKYEELHGESHPHFKWHVDVLAEGHVYHGFVKDISMKGANLFLDHNLQNAKLIKLHIHVPPLVVTSQPRVIEVSAKIISTIYDGNEDSFRSGIIFQKFTQESEQAYLHSRIG
jgi:PilZ domain